MQKGKAELHISLSKGI